jgi:hypothetical protein
MCWLRLVRNAGKWLGLGDDNAWNAGKIGCAAIGYVLSSKRRVRFVRRERL